MKRRYAQLLEKYYNTKSQQIKIKSKLKLYRNYGTNKNCIKCGNQLLVSDLKEYKYLCLECDENFYEFETMDNEKTKKFDKDKIIEAFNYGDATGLDEIENQLKNVGDEDDGDIQEILTCIYKLNYILIETETRDYASKYNRQVQELYIDMKIDLFNRLKINI